MEQKKVGQSPGVKAPLISKAEMMFHLNFWKEHTSIIQSNEGEKKRGRHVGISESESRRRIRASTRTTVIINGVTPNQLEG